MQEQQRQQQLCDEMLQLLHHQRNELEYQEEEDDNENDEAITNQMIADLIDKYDNDRKISDKNELMIERRPDFMEHLIRSPELRLSPVGYQNLWTYDQTVQQLYDQQHQQPPRVHKQSHIEDSLEEKEQRRKRRSNKEEQTEEEYVKIAVGELIHAFEQQAIKQQQEKQREQQISKNEHKNNHVLSEMQASQHQSSIEELYVPPEIPLESYAPPPPMPTALTNATANNFASNTTNNWSPPVPATTWAPKSVAPISRETFPIHQPPKQQYFPPNSYQKVPSAFTPQPSGVNFTPAPLPHDILAKFQQADEPPKPQVTFYNVYEPTKQSSLSPTGFQRAASSPRVIARSARYEVPNYNNLARGWSKGGAAPPTSPARYPTYAGSPLPNPVYASSLPYTDF